MGFVALAWGIYHSTGPRRRWLQLLALLLLIVLVWAGMAMVRPGSV